MNKIKELIASYYALSYKDRTIVTSKLSVLYYFISAIVRLTLGFIFKSIFFIIGGFYVVGLGLIKVTYLYSNREDKTKERKYYLIMNIILLISCVIYVLTTLNYFSKPDQYNYGLIISIGIAAFGFVDLTIAIIGLFRTTKEKDLMFIGIKLVSLTSALTSLALTQSALLTTTGFSNNIDNTLFVGTGGLFFGLLNIIVCCIMFVIYVKTKNNENLINEL